MKEFLAPTVEAQRKIRSYSIDFQQGTVPSINDIMGSWGEMIDLHMNISIALSESFSAKEGANIARKVAQAKNYISFRQKLNGVDSTNQSIEASAKEMKEELDSMSAYELGRILLRSIENTFPFLQSLQSRISQMEKR